MLHLGSSYIIVPRFRVSSKSLCKESYLHYFVEVAEKENGYLDLYTHARMGDTMTPIGIVLNSIVVNEQELLIQF